MFEPWNEAWRRSVVLLATCGAIVSQEKTATSEPTGGQPVVAGAIVPALADDGTPMLFRIDSVTSDPRDRDGDVELYGVSMWNAQMQVWQSYCAPDVEGRSAAIPVQGSWSASGEPEAAGDRITFACTSGAIGKCIRFGYKPWRTKDGISLRPYHAACVRMVRADYCGDGRSHTLDGTWIDIWDDLGIQTREKPDGRPEVFEAAWSPDGAVYLNVPRWSDDVTEVTRECPRRLGGRTGKDGPLSPAKVRERFPEARLFNARFVRGADRRVPAK